MKFLRKYFESRESRLWGDRVFEYFGIALAITFVCYLIFSLIPNKSLGIFVTIPIAIAILSWGTLRKQKSSNFDELPIDHDLYKEVSWEIAGNDLRIFASNENATRILPSTSTKSSVFLYQGLLNALSLREIAALIDLELFEGYTRRKNRLLHYAFCSLAFFFQYTSNFEKFQISGYYLFSPLSPLLQPCISYFTE